MVGKFFRVVKDVFDADDFILTTTYTSGVILLYYTINLYNVKHILIGGGHPFFYTTLYNKKKDTITVRKNNFLSQLPPPINSKKVPYNNSLLSPYVFQKGMLQY